MNKILCIILTLIHVPFLYCRRGGGNLNCECGYFKNDFDVIYQIFVNTTCFICRKIKPVRQNCESTTNFKVSFEESVWALFNSSTLCILWVASQSHLATQGFIKGKIFSVKGHRRYLRDLVWLMIRAPHPSIRTIWYKIRPILSCVKGLQGL